MKTVLGCQYSLAEAMRAEDDDADAARAVTIATRPEAGTDDPALATGSVHAVRAEGSGHAPRRQAADEAIVAHLAAAGFSGPRYDRFSDELAKYGVSVLCGWMHSGYVFRLAAARGFPLGPTEHELDELHRDPDLRRDLAMMVVAVALRRFREEALVRGRWRPDGGASLTTYFMGACLAVFPDEFRKHRAQERRWSAPTSGPETTTTHPVVADDPADVVLSEISVRDDLARMDGRTRAIVALRMDGYRQEEIAEMLNERSVRAVEGVLYRLRAKEIRRGRREVNDLWERQAAKNSRRSWRLPHSGRPVRECCADEPALGAS